MWLWVFVWSRVLEPIYRLMRFPGCKTSGLYLGFKEYDTGTRESGQLLRV